MKHLSRSTHRETTSEGKVCGTDRTFPHRALSLVQVHPAGHLGCLTLRPSATTKPTAATQIRSARPLHPPIALPGYPILSVPAEECHSSTCNLGKIREGQSVDETGSLRISKIYFSASVLLALIIDCAPTQACCLCLLRLNRKALVQRIRSAGRRITNATQARHEARKQSRVFCHY